MNNRDKFDEDRPVPDSAWADLVERLGQEEAGANGQSPDQISASDLHITEIDDLELDGQLRTLGQICLLYTSPSPRDATLSRMPSSA